MNKRYVFPQNFWWGSATSGPQSEGRFNKRHKSVFDYWYDIEPEAFFDRIGPNVASNFYNSYKNDLAMLKEIGLNSFRTSIQWTRLIKDFETGEPDEDGVRFYNDVIDECIKNEMIPVINLHHFDIPVDLYHKYGGWESKHVVELFVKFSETAFKLFGDRVKYWVTFNEPIVIVEGEYLYQFHYPKLVNGKKAVQVLFNLNLASAKVIQAYRKQGQDGQIGIILNLTPSYPRRVKAREVEFDNSNGGVPDKYFENYEMPGRRMNPYRGWEVFECMYDIAINIRDNYKNIPWYISENGMGVEGEGKYMNKYGIIEDDYRIKFFEEHLQYLYKGIEEGANCFGFHSWTPIDCWSWSNAYKNRYGYISVDLATQMKTIKKSGKWIKEVAANNGF